MGLVLLEDARVILLWNPLDMMQLPQLHQVAGLLRWAIWSPLHPKLPERITPISHLGHNSLSR